MKPTKNIPLFFFYLVAFIEGGAVMAIELTGAKMLAPYYGTSLYVWASVLTATLGGLAVGYFLGGLVSDKFKQQATVFNVIAIGAILTALMPIIAPKILLLSDPLGIRFGSLFACLGIIGGPLLCMGMVSPILIEQVAQRANKPGKVAGSVYAISTLGGIVMTLLVGFYLLPLWGIVTTLFFVSLLIVLLVAIYYLFFNFNLKLLIALALVMLFFGLVYKTKANVAQEFYGHKVVYQTEGINGQLTVLDHPDISENNIPARSLLINGITQTYVYKSDVTVSQWGYPHRVAHILSIRKPNENALLLGLAGGSLAMEMKRQGFKVDVVEIDKRMPELASKYFGFEKNKFNIIIDDARHYIQNTNKKYDVIVCDVLNGEVQPWHIFTKEAIAVIKTKLADDGLLVVNFQGTTEGKQGIGTRSLYKTLKAANLKLTYFTKDNDILYVASKNGHDLTKYTTKNLDAFCKTLNYQYSDLVSPKELNLEDAFVFEDDKPMMDHLNQAWIEQWRVWRKDFYAKVVLNEKKALFR